MAKRYTWTVEKVKLGLERFYKENRRYPTGPEIDSADYLPSARTIERRFGGVVKLRGDLGLSGQSDFRQGSHSSERAFEINKRSNRVETEVYEFLIKKFGKEFVHREYFFTDDKRTRADFFIYDNQSGFCVDVFYPKDRRNLVGCLNSKLGKYSDSYMGKYPVIFLQMNAEITSDVLVAIVENKEKKLKSSQRLLGWEGFLEFCNKRGKLSVGR